MYTVPCAKQTVSRAADLRLVKSDRGNMGSLATLYSMKRKRRNARAPKTMRQSTVTEFQAKLTPPNSRPRRTMSVLQRMVRVPKQSIVLRPTRKGFFRGWSSSRSTSIMMAETPSHTILTAGKKNQHINSQQGSRRDQSTNSKSTTSTVHFGQMPHR